MMGKFLKALFSRLVIVGLLIMIQVGFILFTIYRASKFSFYAQILLTFLSILVVLYIIGKDTNPSYKLACAIPILIFPLFGGLLYLILVFQASTRQFSKKIEKITSDTLDKLPQNEETLLKLKNDDIGYSNQAKYILNQAKYPIYQNTTAKYLSPGEEKYKHLLEEIKMAEHYIFLEYFIIEEGLMWNTILSILSEKVSVGVDVRVMFDAMGCLQTLPHNYKNTLTKMGIKCVVFNPFVPAMTAVQNNRDHRKIAIIDGHTAFTGGINLADEYINYIDKHGHWKDASVMIKGEAVWSMTVMFLRMWQIYNNEKIDYNKYRPDMYMSFPLEDDGFIQPYADSPLDGENIGEYIYLNIINKAKRYVYINTPYLIIDNEMLTSLILAAKSGIDVRIVTPHIGDNKIIKFITCSYYPALIRGGVKIYEYTNGFIHSKTFVADDDVATIGSINLDYRSLYLHFECGVWMYKSKAVTELKNDFLSTLDICEEITIDKCKDDNIFRHILRNLLQLFAPML